MQQIIKEGTRFNNILDLVFCSDPSLILHYRTQWELSQPDIVTVHQKICPKEVPGTLLNMALHNHGSSDFNPLV